MSLENLTTASAHQLIDAIQCGEVSSLEVMRAHLDLIAAHDPQLGAFQAVYADAAKHAARRYDRRKIRDTTPLSGLPLAVKDLLHIRGHVTTAGSMNSGQRPASTTATVVACATRQGAIVIGKTRMAEFGLGVTGINPHQGTPRNPWIRIPTCPGGSSSGAAVAVSAGMAPWAIGTDTGGSVRIPAAWCGIVGFKPSQSRLSRRGVVPLSPSHDTVGLLARHVTDVALLYAMLGGSLSAEELARVASAPTRTDQVLRSARLAILADDERDTLEPEVRRHYDRSLQFMAEQGSLLIDAEPPYPWETYREHISKVTMFEAAARYGALAIDPATVMDDRVRALLNWGRQVSPNDYRDIKNAMPRWRTAFDAVFETIDALVIPTTATTAYSLDEAPEHPAPNRFTRFVNFLDLCAVAVPCGLSTRGLPCSVQIICRRGEEMKALEIASVLQSLIRIEAVPLGHLQGN